MDEFVQFPATQPTNHSTALPGVSNIHIEKTSAEGRVKYMSQEKETVYLVDGSSYIYRAYHAIRGLANSKGFPTNAPRAVKPDELKGPACQPSGSRLNEPCSMGRS